MMELLGPLESQKVAVLGLGIIGQRATSRIVEAGWRVSCWNRTPKQLPHEVASAEVAVQEAAIISLYLKDAPAVREVMSRLESRLHAGQIVLNHATLDLETTLWLEKICQARGCEFLDTPFMGSKLAAESGQLIYYTGGSTDLVDRVDHYLSVTSKSRLHCGGVGAATVVKLATNLISACTVQAMAESLAIATRHGVQAECLIEAVSLNACASALSAMKLASMVSENYEPHFSLSNMGKDSRYMLALAEAAGLDTPAIAAVSQRMEALAAGGDGDLDYSAVAKAYQAKA